MLLFAISKEIHEPDVNLHCYKFRVNDQNHPFALNRKPLLTLQIPAMVIVFDVFGTLITQRGQTTNAYSRLISAAGGQRLPFLTRNTGIGTFAHELGIAHLLPVIERELSDELAQLELFEDAPLVLAQLRAKRRTVAVCSNLAQPFGPAVRALLPGLDAYVFSYEVGARKPEPAIYERVCSVLTCKPRDVLWVGDSRRADFEAPRAFGMHACLIDRKAGQTLQEVLRGII